MYRKQPKPARMEIDPFTLPQCIHQPKKWRMGSVQYKRPGKPHDAPEDGPSAHVYWYPMDPEDVQIRERVEGQEPPWLGGPIHLGYLIEDTKANQDLCVWGHLPKPFGCWHWYMCRVCSKQFVLRRAPYQLHFNHCGCQWEPSTPQQTHRLEQQRFGNLTAVNYVYGRGWDCICECGGSEEGVSTMDLRKLHKLACRECAPEEYSGKKGSKPANSMHGRLLKEHKERMENAY